MKNITLYNTLTREKEAFVPLVPGKVGLYVCGVTPYDDSHIGHARVYTVFDTFYRFLKAIGFDVTYVRNFTDIDDKIIQRAKEQGRDPLVLSEQFIGHYHEDMDALNVLNRDIDDKIVEPKVSTHMLDIVALIDTLVEKGIAYVTSSGDVNYDISQFDTHRYCQLSRKKLDDLVAGARVAVSDEKRNPGDFALWKAAKEGEPESVRFQPPKGAKEGRPGWHIECSAMSKKYLGETFDIHGGGEDLQFPHHSNEIAQSEAAHECEYVKTWMHNAFITVGGEKMSKSLGNFVTIRDALKKYSGEAIRLWILQTHYRKPVDFSDTALEAAETRLRRLYKKLEGAPLEGGEVPQDVMEALADDLNTPVALSLLEKAESAAEIKAVGDLLGIFQMRPEEYLKGSWKQAEGEGLNDDQIDAFITERNNARANKDFATSDKIRDDLAAQGVVLEDGPGGTTWRRG